MRSDVYAVLLAGGKGRRLWPLSTQRFSKSFIRLGERRPAVVETLARLRGLVAEGNTFIVVDRVQEKLLKKIVRVVPKKNILVEPFGRSTASAVGLVSLRLKPNDIMVILPTDALIGRVGEYRKTLNNAIRFVTKREDVLVCVGVLPKEAETAYGYIKVKSHQKDNIYSIEKFIEKPDKAKALEFIKRRNYLWNTGVFIFRAKDILHAIERYAPRLYKELICIKKDKRKLEAAYRRMEDVSIDYQIMEKAKNLYCAKGNFLWHDLGNWKNVATFFRRDGGGNRICGKVVLLNTKRSIVYNSTKNRVGVVGLKDTIVACTEDGILVCAKKDAEGVKKVASMIDG